MNEPFIRGSESFFQIDTDPNIYAGISTRCGGVSEQPFHTLNLGLHVRDNKEAVIENRKIFSDCIQAPLQSWVCAEQVHGSQVKKVGKTEAGKGIFHLDDAVKEVDGLYTDERNVVLTAAFADCVPLYFFAPRHHLIGIAHAGWKGTVRNIVSSMVSTWVSKEKLSTNDIYTVIGPSICEKCYKVDDNVIQYVRNVISDSRIGKYPFHHVESNQYLLNLKELNKQLMIKAGIPAENIKMTTYCTSCHNDLFFSYRKEKTKTGRMMAFISLV